MDHFRCVFQEHPDSILKRLYVDNGCLTMIKNTFFLHSLPYKIVKLRNCAIVSLYGIFKMQKKNCISVVKMHLLWTKFFSFKSVYPVCFLLPF